jgi:hypothetical protein
MTVAVRSSCTQPYGAYYSPRDLKEDAELTHVGPGTPCGELFRRYWQPVAYEQEVTAAALPLRILGEDLVLERDAAGALHLQIVENAMDPVHAAYLHVLASGRQRGFSDQVGILPALQWGRSETGMYYIACRRRPDDDLVWVRVVDRFMPNAGILPPNDDMRVEKPNISIRPFQWAWTVPIDNENTKRLYLLLNDDRNPLRPIQRTRGFGQINDRPYEERLRQPGDYEMMASQGRIAVHAYENLTTTDGGVLGFRQMIREGIAAVQAGRDPLGVTRDPATRVRTRTQNTLIRVPRAAAPHDDLALLEATGRRIAEGDQLRTFPPV